MLEGCGVCVHGAYAGGGGGLEVTSALDIFVPSLNL